MPRSQPSDGRPARRVSVLTKILAAVGIGAVASLVIGIVGLVALSSASAGADKIYEQDTLGVDAVQQLRYDFAQFRLASLGETTASDAASREQYAQQKDELRRQLAATQDKVLAFEFSEETEAAITSAVEDLAEYQTLTEELDAVLARGDRETFEERRDAELGPLNDRVVASLATVADSKLGKARERVDAMHSTNSRTRTVLVVVMVVGIAASLAQGVRVARRIVGDVRAVQTGLDALADGDLTVSTTVTSSDELGEMAGSLGRAQTNLRTTLSSMGETSSTVASSQPAPVGVSTASKPDCSAARAIWPR